ncbi:major facilitator superfamily domain-containing protein [Trichoderma chlorosporum]
MMTAAEELLPTHQYDCYREQAHGGEDHHAHSRLSPQGSSDQAPQPFTDNEANWCPRHGIFRTDAAALTGSFMMESLGNENTRPLSQTNQACTCAKKPERNNKKYRIKLIAGLVLPYFLASLDLTVVATALPFIASHFHKFDQLNWIVTAYTLTSTAFIPFYGQFADVFGRHISLQVALFFTVIGSVLCAAAQSWSMLLLGRALQGLSSAGLSSIILVILADKVTLEENAKNNTLFTIVSGSTYAIGPVIGGYLTDANWRYVFVISIPIAVVSHILLFFILRNELLEGTYFHKGSKWSAIFPALATLDIGGVFLFIVAVGLIILGSSWGGNTFPWGSVQVLAPIIVGGALLPVFFFYEFLLSDGRILARLFPLQSPMLPLNLFSRKDTLVIAVIQFSAGAAMYAVFYFVGIYFTLVEGNPASQAGIQLLYYIPGISVGVYSAMYMCNRSPGQTFWPLLLGSIEEAVGLGVLTWAISASKPKIVSGMMVVTGAGTGSRFMPASLHVAGVWPERLAPAMSLMRFAMPFGGTLALTIMNAVFNSKFTSATSSLALPTSGGISAQDTQSLDAIGQLPSALQATVRAAGRGAVEWAFISILPILCLSILACFVLGNVWVKPPAKKDKAADSTSSGQASGGQSSEKEDTGATTVVYVPYLYALLKGVDRYKVESRRSPATEGRTSASGAQAAKPFIGRGV